MNLTYHKRMQLYKYKELNQINQTHGQAEYHNNEPKVVFACYYSDDKTYPILAYNIHPYGWVDELHYKWGWKGNDKPFTHTRFLQSDKKNSQNHE